jgi:hypothetical protein
MQQTKCRNQNGLAGSTHYQIKDILIFFSQSQSSKPTHCYQFRLVSHLYHSQNYATFPSTQLILYNTRRTSIQEDHFSMLLLCDRPLIYCINLCCII